MGKSTFKSVAFGGFDKQDVISYIETTAQEAAAVRDQLESENGALREETQTQREKLYDLEDEVKRLQKEQEALTAKLAAETAANRELESLREENARLKALVEQYQPDAEAYAGLRNKLGTIECEAHQRAEAIETEARSRMKKSASDFREQYQVMMDAFSAAAEHVTKELRNVELHVAQMPRAMDRTYAELKELEKGAACPQKENET